MLDSLFSPVFTDAFTVTGYLVCTLTALLLGALIAFTAAFRSHGASRSLTLSLILLPPIVQTVIILVNGNLGTGVAVMGAFSLVRFRSAPGSAREIVCIFLSMAVGLATAMGYLGIAALFTVIICAVMFAFTLLSGRLSPSSLRELRITVPESLSYTHAFDDLFSKYATSYRLVKVKTSNMGSLFNLRYSITLSSADKEQELINELRCRNGNLEISIGMPSTDKEEL